MRHAICVLLLLTNCIAAQSPRRVEYEAEVFTVRPGGVLELVDGRKVGLQGVSLPSAAVRPKGFDAALKKALLAELAVTDSMVWVTPDTGKQPGVDLVATVRVKRGGISLNETVLRRGLAVFACRTQGVIGLDKLLAAAQQAQRTKAGWFGKSAKRSFDKLPYLNGAVVGLHHQGAKWDYHRQIDELVAAGFKHISFLFSVFVDKVDSNDIRRDHPRTVVDARLIETIRYAKSKQLSVMLLPIVLILEPGDEDWRGVLKPKDEERFWQNYDRFLAHYADIAEYTGVDVFSIGSEFGSLEDRTATWKRLIKNVRGRYRGKLTYSVNWDHADTARFFDDLDIVGMTAYFSLTKKKDPTVAELMTEWQRVAKSVAKSHAWHKRPVMFTELGYASQNGINTDPWNYVMAEDDIDLQEQKDCFEAFRKAAAAMPFLRGAYYYDYYDMGGKDDPTYSPRGKPAMAEWKLWATQGAKRK